MALTQVKAEGIATGAVTTSKLEDDAVSNAKLTSSTNEANRAVGADTVQDDAIGIAALSATGTASSSTFLRGDNSWSTPPGGTSDVFSAIIMKVCLQLRMLCNLL